MVYSPYAGPSYPLTGFTTSASYLEGHTFDPCGGHSSSSSSASYHYHNAPSCLLAQLGMTAGSHSPQVGWMADGFPLYGPLGPSGTVMQTCTVTGGTFGVDVCTDDCAGYLGETGDGYTYRYYMLGAYNDGQCVEGPGSAYRSATAFGGAEYYPFTPVCLNGCCPAGVSCAMINGQQLPTCSGGTAGTTSGFTPVAKAALPINSAAVSTEPYAAAAESTLCCDLDDFGATTQGSNFCEAPKRTKRSVIPRPKATQSCAPPKLGAGTSKLFVDPHAPDTRR